MLGSDKLIGCEKKNKRKENIHNIKRSIYGLVKLRGSSAILDNSQS
jgi:hypothetical protein